MREHSHFEENVSNQFKTSRVEHGTVIFTSFYQLGNQVVNYEGETSYHGAFQTLLKGSSSDGLSEFKNLI